MRAFNTRLVELTGDQSNCYQLGVEQAAGLGSHICSKSPAELEAHLKKA